MSFFLNPKIVKKGDGGCVAEYAKVAAAGSSSFLKGELVYLNAGVATVVASNGQVVYGIAQEDGPVTATTKPTLTVEIIRPEDEVEITCDATVTYAEIGVKYAVLRASNVHYCDTTDTDNDAMTIVRPVLDLSGAFTTKAIVHFLPTVCQSAYQVG
jgi:hypothetical protein